MIPDFYHTDFFRFVKPQGKILWRGGAFPVKMAPEQTRKRRNTHGLQRSFAACARAHRPEMQGLSGVQRSRLRQHDARSRLEGARQRRERQLARVAALEPEHGHDRAEHARGHVARALRADVFPARDRGAHRLAARAVQPRRRHPRLQRLCRGGRRAELAHAAGDLRFDIFERLRRFLYQKRPRPLRQAQAVPFRNIERLRAA